VQHPVPSFIVVIFGTHASGVLDQLRQKRALAYQVNAAGGVRIDLFLIGKQHDLSVERMIDRDLE
jgi:hypothetical protein